MARTLEELAALPRETVTCQEIAPIIGIRGDTLHQTAIERPSSLPFPVIAIGRRVAIPKRAFIRFMEEGRTG